ncbi:uncharacterized protein O9250_012303 [Rhynochetos jubatus]
MTMVNTRHQLKKKTPVMETMGCRMKTLSKRMFHLRRDQSIKMAMKGEFALNAEVAKKGKRQTSGQKAEQQMSSSSGNHFQVLDDSTVSETSPDEGRYSGNWMKKSPKNLNRVMCCYVRSVCKAGDACC